MDIRIYDYDSSDRIRISIENIFVCIFIFYRYLLKAGYHSRREVRTMALPAATVQSGTVTERSEFKIKL